MTRGSRRPSPPGVDGVPEWVADSVFYQIFPDRFAASDRVDKPGPLEPWDAPPTRTGFKGGDLLGVVERLDHLVDLGVDAIYLNPIFASASNHRYHPYDYFRVDPLLGGEAAFRELLDAAHSRGIRLILDGVFNHASRGFWPFHHVLENGADSPYADWFFIREWPPNAYDHRRTPGYEAWWGMHALPKLDVCHPQVRRHLLEAVEHWTRQGIDGWRLDVPQEIDDPEFWPEFRRRVRALRPDAYLVGEVWDEAPEWIRGDRFDALMNYPFARVAHGFACDPLDSSLRFGSRRPRRQSAARALEALARLANAHPGDVVRAQLNLLGSHDTPRFRTLAGGDAGAYGLATLLQMTFPGAPCIYYGDEVGMEGGEDPACRGGFPRDASGFHAPTLDLVRRAIALRRRWPALRHGSFEPVAARGRVLAYVRRGDDDAFLVAINAGRDPARRVLALPEGVSPRDAEEVWDDGAPAVAATRASRGRPALRIELAARSGRVLRLRRTTRVSP